MMTNTNTPKYNKANPEALLAVIAQLPTHLASFLTPYTAEDYVAKNATCYVSDCGRSGYAITEDGELISVVSLPGARHGFDVAINAVENGAKKLDCLGSFLVKLYGAVGFVVVEEIEWDDQYAPENWDYEKFGRLNVYVMERK